MPHYSVNVYGDSAESVASDLRHTFRGKPADYTGHAFFYVENHRDLKDFETTVNAMLPDGHEAAVRKITKAQYDGR